MLGVTDAGVTGIRGIEDTGGASTTLNGVPAPGRSPGMPN